MTATYEQKLEAYNEAKSICEKCVNYKGDKRRMYFKTLQRGVVDIYIGRMNNFGKQLNLPLFDSLYD